MDAGFFIHFTDKVAAQAIVYSLRLLACSYITLADTGEKIVFAAMAGGIHCPGTQQHTSGIADDRDWAVVFTTDVKPDLVFPEEVRWVGDYLPLTEAFIVPADEAIAMLDGSEVDEDILEAA